MQTASNERPVTRSNYPATDCMCERESKSWFHSLYGARRANVVDHKLKRMYKLPYSGEDVNVNLQEKQEVLKAEKTQSNTGKVR